MLLRSASTPVLGSLLSSFSDSPSRDFSDNNNNHNNKHYPSSSSSDQQHLKRISFSHGGNHSFASFTCNSSPLPRSLSGFSDSDREVVNGGVSSRGFRRAQSDGNLEGLAAASCDFDDLESSCLKPPRRKNSSMLQTIPSFSIYNSLDGYEEDEDLEDGEVVERGSEMDDKDGFLERTVTIGDAIMAHEGSDDFSFERKMDFISEEERGSSDLCYLGADEEEEEEGEQLNPPMFLARGLGMDMGGFGGGMGTGFNRGMFGEGGQDGSEIGEYYKKMVQENPCSPLFLRNYAQFLYKTKGDLPGADEYYSRAILADPQDGEILSQYAKLVWELHRDHERASSYFERAVQAAPEDSHVHAAYASFLWETEDNDKEEESLTHDNHVGMMAFHRGAMASANA